MKSYLNRHLKTQYLQLSMGKQMWTKCTDKVSARTSVRISSMLPSFVDNIVCSAWRSTQKQMAAARKLLLYLSSSMNLAKLDRRERDTLRWYCKWIPGTKTKKKEKPFQISVTVSKNSLCVRLLSAVSKKDWKLDKIDLQNNWEIIYAHFVHCKKTKNTTSGIAIYFPHH